MYTSLFLAFALVSFGTGIFLELSGILNRAELQTIDRRFEARRWIDWSPEGLNRLNLGRLIQYHEQHEIPRRWWSWDYTLSWLLEPNHIPVLHRIVVFNHLLEDEPPQEALAEHPWMKPLMQFPISRATVADTIKFLARSGARLIILDNDFPQYSPDDAVLANAIHACSSGQLTGHKVPILMASTVNHRSFANVLQLDLSSGPAGILRCLEKLEPGVDVQSKYTGTTSMILDEDQVVRRSACRPPDRNDRERPSIAIKSLLRLGEGLPSNLPDEMDIDFAGPPNSELYPVRPFSYLIDPEMQRRISASPGSSDDVSLQGAIVILGDGVTDLYATPFTNLGVNLMSGPEILAQTIDTVARKSWHYRLSPFMNHLYLLLCSVISGAALCLWKAFYSSRLKVAQTSLARPLLDLSFSFALVVCSFILSSVLFCDARLIVPVLVPAAAIMVASLATALWEQENVRARWLQQQLDYAEERLKLQEEKHDAELKRQLAEAHMQEVTQDQQRRYEFVRKINHDLKAPVTVMSWILAKLVKGGLSQEVVTEKIDKLAKTSNRLVDLLHELAKSYESTQGADEEHAASEPCQLNRLLQDCISMAAPLAEMKSDVLTLNVPERILWVTNNPLHVSRIFDNLIRNAILHNPLGTCIHVEARSRAHVHQITVSDNGAGIPAEEMSTLLVKKSDKAIGPNGMGLQIALAFVESMGGKITVESEVGVGTTFVVSLPSSHLEAGGESGEDILSTGQHRIVDMGRAATAAKKGKTNS